MVYFGGFVGCIRSLIGRSLIRPFWSIRKKYHQIFDTKFVRSRYGVIMRANWGDSTFNGCYYAGYGWVLSRFVNSLNSQFIFLDIGANQGLYSLIAAKNSNCTQVIAFEPVARTYALLTQNIEANGLSGKVLAVQAAVSSSSGELSIRVPKSHSGGATLGDVLERDVESVAEMIKTVDVLAIDGLITGAGEIVIKIDVEGHEDVVIAELMKSGHLERISAIFYEVDERWVVPQVLAKRLEANGFRSFTVYGGGKHYDVLARR